MTSHPSPLSLLNDPSLLRTDALVNGHWVAGTSRFDVHDPATGEKLADVANLGSQEAEAAIVAANAAWPAWRPLMRSPLWLVHKHPMAEC